MKIPNYSMDIEVLKELMLPVYIEVELEKLLTDVPNSRLFNYTLFTVDLDEVIETQHAEEDGIYKNYIASMVVTYNTPNDLGSKEYDIVIDKHLIDNKPVTNRIGRKICEDIANKLQVCLINDYVRGVL